MHVGGASLVFLVRVVVEQHSGVLYVECLGQALLSMSHIVPSMCLLCGVWQTGEVFHIGCRLVWAGAMFSLLVNMMKWYCCCF